MRTVLQLALALAIGIFVGAKWTEAQYAAAPEIPAPPTAYWEHREYKDRDPPVPCPADAVVIVVAGQSNAANSVGQRFSAKREVYELDHGRCYRASGALAGADGSYGSLWPLVGDALIARGFAPRVIFVAAAMGGTSIDRWSKPDDLGGYLAKRLKSAKGAQYVLWHQGEADMRMSEAAYGERLSRVILIIKTNAPDARLLIAQTSLCGDNESAGVLKAQAAVVDQHRGIYAGPNTDAIRDFDDRYDGCHFSEPGARAAAIAWAQKILEARATGDALAARR